MLPLDEVRAFVLERVSALEPVSVARDDALACVLAEPVVAPEAVPPFANSAMDGYAVRAADTADAPVDLVVTGTLAAGADPAAFAVERGTAVRIMTGAAMPAGADAIVIVELTEPLDDGARVRVEKPAHAGDHIRDAGDDIAEGATVLSVGTELRAAHLGVLASIGVASVRAHRRPRVGVLSTGDELVDDGAALQPGQIRDSNRAALVPMVRAAGADVVDLGLVRDDREAIADAITAATRECDALLTSGGVSMGDFDWVKQVLDELGEMRWMQVAIRPAKPFAFGLVGDRRVPVFGLPGNPVSSLVSFELFARPAIRRMLGHADDELDRPRVHAVCDDDGCRRRPDGKLHLARVVARFDAHDGRVHVRSAGGQGSHQLSAMANANALAFIPDGDGVGEGGEVAVALLSIAS